MALLALPRCRALAAWLLAALAWVGEGGGKGGSVDAGPVTLNWPPAMCVELWMLRISGMCMGLWMMRISPCSIVLNAVYKSGFAVASYYGLLWAYYGLLWAYYGLLWAYSDILWAYYGLLWPIMAYHTYLGAGCCPPV